MLGPQHQLDKHAEASSIATSSCSSWSCGAASQRQSTWTRWRASKLIVSQRWGSQRQSKPSTSTSTRHLEALAPRAKLHFERAASLANAANDDDPSQDHSIRKYMECQQTLRYFNTIGEPECRLAESLQLNLTDLEAAIRQRATSTFEKSKFELARSGNNIRAELLRPPLNSVSTSQVWDSYRQLRSTNPSKSEESLRLELLQGLSGCSREDAAECLQYAQKASELFAPVEAAARIARQDWNGKTPSALGAGLLLQLEAAIDAARQDAKGARPHVVIFGGCCITAALAARLGCSVLIVEPNKQSRMVLKQILKDNSLHDRVIVSESAGSKGDIFVWEGVCEDTVLGLGQLQALSEALRPKGVDRSVRVVPAHCRFWANVVDDSLPSIRGFDLSRLERLRGYELALPRRWPKGACHIEPRHPKDQQLAESSILLWDLDMQKLGEWSPLQEERKDLKCDLTLGAAVTGVAFWVEISAGKLPPAQQSEHLGSPWVMCLQSLPPRRVSSPGSHGRPDGSVSIGAHCTLDRIWFEWGTDDVNTSILPAFGKVVLPSWHFKMMNDHVRNYMYDAAISAVVVPQSGSLPTSSEGREDPLKQDWRTLDCGCGIGLLSLLASRSGKAKVTSIELSPVIADIAEQTFLSEGRADVVTLRTGDVRGCPRDQVGQHNVILCELMDASGLGESVLGVLRHACGNLAAKKAKVVPRRLRLSGGLGFVGLPECHGSVNFAALEPFYLASRRGGPFANTGCDLEELAGGAGAKGSPGPPTLQSGAFASKNLNRLRRGEHDAWDLLTPVQSFLNFDLESALQGQQLYPVSDEIEIVATRCGVLNAILWWWSADIDETHTLSNEPIAVNGAHETHWHQPMLPIGPFPVRKGDRFLLKIELSDVVGQKLSFTLRPADPSASSVQFWKPGPQGEVRLPPEPLEEELAEWRTHWEAACESQNSLLARHTRQGDLVGLATLQKAVLAIIAHPRLFGCDPHVRDRLLLTFFGISFK